MCRHAMNVNRAEADVVAAAVIDGTLATFRANKGWADKAIGQVSDERLHVALDANTNSIAVFAPLKVRLRNSERSSIGRR